MSRQRNKKLIFPGIVLALIFSILFELNQGLAKNEEGVIKSFENIVARFNLFFKKKQKLVSKQSFPDSPTRIVAEIIEYECGNITYDIEKTKSLLSPFVGYITLNLISLDNSSCGNVEISGHPKPYGWKTVDGAITEINNEKCYKFDIIENDGKPFVDVVRLNFAYQNKKWIFKGAIRPVYGRPAIANSTTLGVPVGPGIIPSEPDAIKINKKWLDLIG